MKPRVECQFASTRRATGRATATRRSPAATTCGSSRRHAAASTRAMSMPNGVQLCCGVTAVDRSDAERLLKAHVFADQVPGVTGVVEAVDVRDLDRGHVLPNMGGPSRRGVWWPPCQSVTDVEDRDAQEADMSRTRECFCGRPGGRPRRRVSPRRSDPMRTLTRTSAHTGSDAMRARVLAAIDRIARR